MRGKQISDGVVTSKIYVFRGQNVMLDADLAELYGVTTKRLNQQVSRNIERFPEDFMFQLTDEEFNDLKEAGGGNDWGGRRYAPYSFTEHGVLMLSSVLKSARAIEVNIKIVRVFARMRAMLSSSQDLLTRMERIEGRLADHDDVIAEVFEYLRLLIDEPPAPRRRIGYHRDDHLDQS